jgi:hypothetical protein
MRRQAVMPLRQPREAPACQTMVAIFIFGFRGEIKIHIAHPVALR